MSTLNAWDVVDANNNAAPPDGWPENTMNYSDVNNTGRAVQGTVKRFFDDINGSLDAGGVADAYTVTLNETGYLAYFAGMYFACEIMATNTGASTIDVNGIGVQTITDRAGNALTAGELQSGGIYEFRYDGVNFQLMGTVAGAVNIPSAVLSNTNEPDLVDTDVALNVGAADPDAAQHLEFGPTTIQSKSDISTAATLSLNTVGGVVQLGADGGVRFETVTAGVAALRSQGNTDAEPRLLVLRHQDGTQRGFMGNNSNANLELTNQIDAGHVLLFGRNTASGTVTLMNADPDALTYFGGPGHWLFSPDQTTIFTLGVSDHAVNLVSDVNNDILEFSMGVNEGVNGIRARFFLDDTAGEFGIQASATSGIPDFRIILGATQNAFSAVQGGAATMWYNGVVTATTRADGISLRGDLTDVVLNLEDNGGTQIGFIRIFEAAAGQMEIRNSNDSGHIELSSDSSGSVNRVLIDADPDDDVALFDAGTEVARTLPAASGGFEANNTLTGAGFERVLTTSDAGGGVFQTVNKSTTTSRNTTVTKTADPDLTLPSSVTGDRYLIIGMIQWNETAGASQGLRWTFASSSGSHLISITAMKGTNAVLSTPTMAQQTGSSDINMTNGDATNRRMPVSIQVETLTGGGIEMQWAQVASNANNTNVLGGIQESNLVQFKVN